MERLRVESTVKTTNELFRYWRDKAIISGRSPPYSLTPSGEPFVNTGFDALGVQAKYLLEGDVPSLEELIGSCRRHRCKDFEWNGARLDFDGDVVHPDSDFDPGFPYMGPDEALDLGYPDVADAMSGEVDPDKDEMLYLSSLDVARCGSRRSYNRILCTALD